MIAERTRVPAEWLDLREPADARARDRGLVGHLRRHLPGTDPCVVHDLACGTGSLGRWLAPLLAGPQRWVLHDLDDDLLEAAAAKPPHGAAGSPVEVETRLSDVTRLSPGDLANAALVTASALLDLLTRAELAGLVEVCAEAECPVLLSLSVVGRVELSPAHPLDAPVAAAFNAHQRRRTPRGRLLGPAAVPAAVSGFRRRGAKVLIRPSPWRLGTADSELASQWLTGWIGAACAQSADLAADIDSYAQLRFAQAQAGELAVTVGHADLLVLP
jgi:hypothetical protein